MQNDQTYQLAWLIYALGAAGLAAIAGYWVRRWGGSWAAVFTALLVSLVFLLTPARATEATERLAPAFVVAVFDALSNEAAAFTRAGAPLLWLVSGALLLGLLAIVILHLRIRRHEAPAGGS